MNRNTLSRISRILLLSLVLLCATHVAQAQAKHSIFMLADGRGDTIALRWGPSDAVVWQLGNKYGYLLERFTISRGGKLLSEPEPEKRVLSPQAIKPLPEAEWASVVKANEYAEAVLGMIYDPSEAGNEPSWAGLSARRSEQDQRFGFSLLLCDLYPDVAHAAALSRVDTDVKPDEVYAYRIRLAFVPEGMEIEPTMVVLSAADAYKLPPLTRIQAQFLDRKVELSWPVADHKGYYTSYRLERSTDSIHFASVTPLPIIPMSEDNDPTEAYYTDSIPANGVKYYYRVSGVTPFGTRSLPSPVVSGAGQRLFEARPAIDTAYILPDGRAMIRWRLDAAYQPLVKEVAVFCAEHHDGPYVEVGKHRLAATATQQVDEVRSWPNSYYRVHVFGHKADEVAVSFPYFVQREDSIPPAPPIGLRGVADTTGVVYLQWAANGESDVFGYRMFRANGEGEEFSEVTTDILVAPHFRDSINLRTITPYVYYKLVALDKRFNTSDYSEVLKLRRPDTIPPAPPVIIRSGIEKNAMFLQLEYGPSTDVAGYELYRLSEEPNTRELLAKWKEAENPAGKLADSLAAQGHRYRLIVVAIDSCGNRSEVSSRSFFFETGLRPAISDVQLTVDREAKKVTLVWGYPLATEIDRYLIYRAKEGDPMILYKTLDASQTRYDDTELNPNNRYTYKLKALLKGGAVSQMSKGWEVKY